MQVIWAEEAERDVAAVKQRVLSLFDLVCIGVGGTVGSGVFVLTAEIATQQAGAAVSLCWLLAALTCTLSGLSYMEMCGRVPSGGTPTCVPPRKLEALCASPSTGPYMPDQATVRDARTAACGLAAHTHNKREGTLRECG
jgi:amino acid permease